MKDNEAEDSQCIAAQVPLHLMWTQRKNKPDAKKQNINIQHFSCTLQRNVLECLSLNQQSVWKCFQQIIQMQNDAPSHKKVFFCLGWIVCFVCSNTPDSDLLSGLTTLIRCAGVQQLTAITQEVNLNYPPIHPSSNSAASAPLLYTTPKLFKSVILSLLSF